MSIAIAHVPTAQGAKYMRQLLKHWSHKLETSLDGDRGTVRFAEARATFEAGVDTLTVILEARPGPGGEAETDAVLARMKSVLATHLDRFAFREAPLKFDWKVAA